MPEFLKAVSGHDLTFWARGAKSMLQPAPETVGEDILKKRPEEIIVGAAFH